MAAQQERKKSFSEIVKSEGIGYMIFKIFSLVFTVTFVLLCVYPFYYIFIYSISEPYEAAKGIILLPQGFNLDTYKDILKDKEIYTSFLISVSRAVIGSAGTILCSSMFAFVVSRRETYFRKLLYRSVIASMYLNAGLIPWYLTMSAYGLKDNFLLYVLPYLIGPFYVVLIKVYMESLPASVEEAAKIDGAGALTIFFKIVMPISIPIIATIAVFSSVAQWNYWTDNYFLVNAESLQTMQMRLYDYLSRADAIAQASRNASSAAMEGQVIEISSQSIKMCTTMITTLPILLVYPFMQKHFVKGIMLGAVKG